MVAKSFYRGHKIYSLNGSDWKYEDTDKPTSDLRGCVRCGRAGINGSDHDACITDLRGVVNACCGHGNDEEAYIQFMDGSVVRGTDAVVIQNILKNEVEGEAL